MTEYTPEEYQERLAEEVALQRVRREARRLVDAEDRPPAALPEVLTLRERLARPRDAVAYRIEGWQPAGSRVVLVAQFKAGKTTMVGNLARVLVDGGLFLGRDLVTPVTGAVALVDFEMSPAQIDAWLADQKITGDDRVVVLPMRGAAGAFDILDPDRRAEWAKLLRERDVAYLVLDCLRPVLDALGLDEHHDAGRFLTAFDTLMGEAGVSEACVVHHMGHYNERSRGDSRIRDWPDVEWRLVRQDEDPASPRYVAAYGRDVEQPEAQLHFDPTTRHLTLQAGNRRDAGARAALDAVMAHLRSAPGQSGNAVETALAGTHAQKAVRAALALGVQAGQLRTQPGPRNATLYSVMDGSRSWIMPVTSGSSSLTNSAGERPQGTQPSDEVVSAGHRLSSSVRHDLVNEVSSVRRDYKERRAEDELKNRRGDEVTSANPDQVGAPAPRRTQLPRSSAPPHPHRTGCPGLADAAACTCHIGATDSSGSPRRARARGSRGHNRGRGTTNPTGTTNPSKEN